MERECEACGVLFTTNNKIRKYCDKCTGKGWHLRRQADNQSLRIGRLYEGPKIQDWKCIRCGKIFKAPYKLVVHKEYGGIDEEDKIFCSKKCHGEYLNSIQTCTECGRLLSEKAMNGYNPFDKSTHFCSNTCAHKNYIKEMENRGWVHTCEHCGKIFIRNGGWFCSQQCAINARKNGWVRPVQKSEDDKWF